MIMKTWIYIKCLIVVVLCLILTNCSNESDIIETKVSSKDLKFVVSVSGFNNTRAQSDSKTGWVKGDEIIAAIDKDKNNLLVLTYNGEEWNAVGYGKDISITSKSGSVNAIYADEIEVRNDNKIAVSGDILTTSEGQYKFISEDVVYINLNMNVRPIAKIRISGIPEGFWLDNIIQMKELNISDMTWDPTSSNSIAGCEIEKDGSFTYYGMLDSENGNTTVVLKNDKGYYYKKTFLNKRVSAGDFILIDGPLTGNDWNYLIPLEKIHVKSEINIIHGEESNLSIYDYIEIVPENASYDGLEFSSSDDNVATIDSDGKIVGHNKGRATISVKAKNTNIVSYIPVNVNEISSFISLSLSGTSISITNGSIYYGRIYRFSNNSNADVYVKTLSTSNSIDVNRTVKGGEYTDIGVSFRYDVYPKITVVYSYKDKDYSVVSY